MHRLKASIALSAFALTLSQVARAQDEQPTPLTPIPGPSSAGPTEGQSSPAPTPQSTSEGPTERPSSPATLPPVVVEKPVVRRTNVKPKPRPNLHAERRPVTRAASVERQPSSLQPVGPPPASDGSGPLTSGQTSGTNAYAVSDSTTATKTNTPLMQTPATVTVVPQQVLIDQAVTDLQGAMRNVPGVTVGGGASNDSGAALLRPLHPRLPGNHVPAERISEPRRRGQRRLFNPVRQRRPDTGTAGPGRNSLRLARARRRR